MRIAGYIISTILAVFAAVSCLVENDMSYPHVYAEVTAFAVDGQVSADIDPDTRTISVVLSETADMTSVMVTEFAFTEAATCDDLKNGDIIDLSSPVKIVLDTYQHYEWTIVATQPIERYVKCQGQLEDAEIDTEHKLVYVRVSDSEDLSEIIFESIKLEPEGAVFKGYEDNDGNLVADTGFPLTLDCNRWRYFIFEHKGMQTRWGVNVVLMNVELSLSQTNAWAVRADVSAVFDGSGQPYFRYGLSGSDVWTDVTDVSISGSEVSATITGLTPATAYDLMVVNGDVSEEGNFTTEEAAQVENSDFDDWYKNGSVWMPDLSADYHVWDSANPGSGSFGITPTTPEEVDVAVSGQGKKAAKLESKKALIVLAAGNIYTGKFGRTSGLGASIDWGVPFTSRPLALKGWYKYQPKAIDMVKSPYEDMKGQTDICQIQVLLTDWDKPFTINTNTGTFVDVDNDPGIIAHGVLETSETMSDYEEFRIDLDYRDMTRKPTYIVITACASRYGDYFTGGVGSTLYVDEFELVYDGDVVKAPGVE